MLVESPALHFDYDVVNSHLKTEYAIVKDIQASLSLLRKKYIFLILIPVTPSTASKMQTIIQLHSCTIYFGWARIHFCASLFKAADRQKTSFLTVALIEYHANTNKAKILPVRICSYILI